MKKYRCIFAMLFAVLFCFTACGKRENDTESDGAETVSGGENTADRQEPEDGSTQADVTGNADTDGTVDANVSKSSILVAYFSCTGNTKKIAEYVAELTGGDLYEIVPAVPYTDADLDYGNADSRSSREQNDTDARPAISGTVENMENYDTVFIATALWWSDAPRIICTFLESYDFDGKTMIPLCTSGSSGISGVESRMHDVCKDDVKWLPGQRFSADSSKEDVELWLDGLGIFQQDDGGNTMYIKVNGQTLTAQMADNSSAKALLDLLKDGDITVEAHDYGNFEKVGDLGVSLPTNDEQITTQAGDLILYLGNNFSLYYDTNSWNFTRLGKLTDISQAELTELLGEGDATLVLSLNP